MRVVDVRRHRPSILIVLALLWTLASCSQSSQMDPIPSVSLGEPADGKSDHGWILPPATTNRLLFPPTSPGVLHNLKVYVSAASGADGAVALISGEHASDALVFLGMTSAGELKVGGGRDGQAFTRADGLIAAETNVGDADETRLVVGWGKGLESTDLLALALSGNAGELPSGYSEAFSGRVGFASPYAFPIAETAVGVTLALKSESKATLAELINSRVPLLAQVAFLPNSVMTEVAGVPALWRALDESRLSVYFLPDDSRDSLLLTIDGSLETAAAILARLEPVAGTEWSATLGSG
jgi:hypothetical protein